MGSRIGPSVIGILFALGLVPGAASAKTLLLADTLVCYNPGPYIEVLEDPRKSLTIGDVTSPSFASRFRTYEKHTVSFGLSSSVYWLRLTLAGNNPETEWILSSDRPFLSSLQIYFPVDLAGTGIAGNWTVRTLGFSERPGMWMRPESRISLALPSISTPPRTLYLRIADDSPLFLPLLVGTESALLREARERMFVIGMYIGIMFALALFNGFLFATLRDWSYFWYVLYLVSFSIFFLGTSGVIYQYLFTTPPEWSIRISLASAAFSLGTAGIFARSFLFTRRFAPFADQAFKVTTLVGTMLMALCLFVPMRPLTMFFCAFGTACAAFMIGSAIYCVRRGFRPAWYFLFAWLFLGGGTVVSALTSDGIIPFSLAGFLGVYIGSAAEATLLAFALADRIRALREERETALREERRSQEMALTDGLTHLYNARYFQTRIEEEVCTAEETGQPLSMLMLDVDNFKWYNDTHGHPEGDRVLEMLGRTILGSIREHDTAFRCGGEEFAVLLQKTPGAEALRVAERIRETWETSMPPMREEDPLSPTVSIGVSELVSGQGSCDLIMRADRALYQAKRTGKNRCKTEFFSAC